MKLYEALVKVAFKGSLTTRNLGKIRSPLIQRKVFT